MYPSRFDVRENPHCACRGSLWALDHSRADRRGDLRIAQLARCGNLLQPPSRRDGRLDHSSHEQSYCRNAEHGNERLPATAKLVRACTQLDSPGLHIIRYEDMLSAPEKTLGGVAAFLGLRPPRERLLRAIERSGFEELQQREEAHGFKERGRYLKTSPDHAALRIFLN